MATHLDLQEQEQLDQLKDFWKQWGTLITVVLLLVVGSMAAFNGWRWYERDQAVKASAMYDELERVAQAGDVERVARVFGDLKERFPRTAFAQQGGLLAAKVQYDKAQPERAAEALQWVADKGSEPEYRTIARLRLAGVLLDQKKHDEALRQLDGADVPEFRALVDDRRGDILLAQGKNEEAKAAYRKAWDAMPAQVEYRQIIDAKLTALGASPQPTPGAAASSSAPSSPGTSASAPASAPASAAPAAASGASR